MAKNLIQTLASGDTDFLLAVIGDLVKTLGMAQVLRNSWLGRECLYKVLTDRAKSRLGKVFKLPQTVGVHIYAQAQVH
jgi:probable addiction module antidote protein